MRFIVQKIKLPEPNDPAGYTVEELISMMGEQVQGFMDFSNGGVGGLAANGEPVFWRSELERYLSTLTIRQTEEKA